MFPSFLLIFVYLIFFFVNFLNYFIGSGNLAQHSASSRRSSNAKVTVTKVEVSNATLQSYYWFYFYG